MKLKSDDIISAPCATYIGTLTWIDWENNVGKATLDPKQGEDPVEVDCTFRYMGQHWIWNMDAYPEEDAASHSAFAFCIGDRVVLLHKDKKREPGQQEEEEGGKEYVGVAVLKEEDDGDGGKITSIWKRKVWPLYRIGHEALVLFFKYAELDGKGAGFPFLSYVWVNAQHTAFYYDGRRELVNPFIDQRGHERAFGTPWKEGGSGNPRLVVTREADENGETIFIPHAIHEFHEMGEKDITVYLPDVLMQTRANYRGRIIGWSIFDHLLIDNIPIFRVATEDIERITPSWRAATKKIICVNEANNTLTILFVTMDCFRDWRDKANSGVRNMPDVPDEEYWYPPLYAYYVQSLTIPFDELCIYAAMETPLNELPVISLRQDAKASWLWEDVVARDSLHVLYNQMGNLDERSVEIVSPGHTTELFFWGGCARTTGNMRRKIALSITLAEDGSLQARKSLGDLVSAGCCNENNLESWVEFATRTYTTSTGNVGKRQYILKDHAKIKETLVEEAARVGDAALTVEVSGIDDYEVDQETGVATYNTDLKKAYWHRSGTSSFMIAEEKQVLSGTSSTWVSGDQPEDTVRVTLSMIVFTLCDVRNGVYGYWEITLLDDVRAWDVAYGQSEVNVGKNVTCDHYMASAAGKVRSHRYAWPIPFGSGNDEEIIVKRGVLSGLIQGSMVNTPGTSGFDNPKHYTHNIYNLPRRGFKNVHEDGLWYYPELGEAWWMKWREFAAYYTGTNMDNEIYTWLQGTTSLHGTKRMGVRIRKTVVSDFFSYLYPFSEDEIGIWPHYRNCDLGYVTEAWESMDSVDYNPALAGILWSENMEFEGTAMFGGFAYSVRLKKDGEQAVRVASPNMEKLYTCTGREDAVISVE